jgi:ATP-dependent helicase HrpB
MTLLSLPDLPLSQYREDFLLGLRQKILLLEAEPGAGKSTLAPLWALQETPAGKSVWLIQPRVLAAQALAQRLAHLLGETPGHTVGFQVPYESCSSAHTRLLLMTPGILLQHLLRDPTLDGVAVVMLDEIHERSVNQDTAWAFLQEVQILRDDLQLVLMSATPDPALQRQIPQRLFAAGRCFPITTQFQPPKQNAYQQTEKVDEHVLRVLLNFPAWQDATTLVFLPGWREIEDCARVLQQHFPAQKIVRLHSRVAVAEQAKALDPQQGPRVILSTNIAETSLTIADITLVIDTGLVRRAEYEQRTGLTRLRTARISQASADQRRGRAGRVQAGHCIRLWSQDQVLAAADLPEIRTTDYLPMALRLAHWGSDVKQLNWLEPPNLLAMQQAQQQLRAWGLLDVAGKVTRAGEQVSQLGVHPRVAVLLQSAGDKVLPRSVMLLALALHFELAAQQDVDAWLEDAEKELQRNHHWRLQQKRWLSVLNLREEKAMQLIPQSLALAFNDRIGYRQESGRYRLNSGISIEPQHRLDSAWAVFPHIQPRTKGHSGAGVALNLTEVQQRELSQRENTLIFKNNAWQRHSIWRMGGVIIAEQMQVIANSDVGPEVVAHIRALVAEKGFDHLHWHENAMTLLQRSRLIAQYNLLKLPALDDETLVATLDVWLQPFLTSQTAMNALPWQQGMEFYLGYETLQKLQAILPQKIQLPSGRFVPVEFSADGTPQVAAKLQEFFGCEHLQLADGRIPLRIHLLSPNGSPLAITTDLRSFWQQGYPDVRKDMRGRYPRHPWPDNPLDHVATALTKKRLQHNAPS